MKVYKLDEFAGSYESVSISKNHITETEPVHEHAFIEIVYISEGSGKQYINDTEYDVSKGDIVFINYNQTHAFSSNGSMTYYNCLLKPEFMSGELVNTENIYAVFALSMFDEFDKNVSGTRQKASFRGREMLEIESIVENMLTEFSEKKVGYMSVIKGYMQVFFAKLIRKIQDSNQNDIAGYIHKITPDILKYIDDNLTEKLTLTELAEKCFYNPDYFSRMFKQCCGKSLTSYICEKRMERAMQMLSQTDMPVGEVCSAVGYNDKTQFYKAFRRHSGTTPGGYREKYQNTRH